MTQTVNDFCDEAGHQFWPAMGCGTPADMPNYRPPKGAQLSRDGNVYVQKVPILNDRGRATGERRRFMAHADAYKQSLHAGFFLAPEEPGAVRLFDPVHRKDHHSYARHLTAEMQIEKTPGVFKWQKARGRADNHYLDATYLSLCAVSILEHRFPSLAITGVAEAAEDSDQSSEDGRPRVVSITEVEI